MLDGKKVKPTVGSSFDPLPMDKYTVQITDVNLKSVPKFKSTEYEDVLNYEFVVLDEKEFEVTDDGAKKMVSVRGRKLWHRCRLAINNKSWWGKLIKAAIGRDLTKEEIPEFDPESLVGKQVDVVVEQNESKDGTTVFNNIISFNKTAKLLVPVVDEKGTAVAVINTSSVPATAPKDEVDKFAEELEGEETEESLEELELKMKIAKAKAAEAKKAKAK